MLQSDSAAPGPVRMCAVCRTRKPASELIRFVVDGENLVVDLGRKRIGRGVHLGISLECARQALKRGVFRRAFGAQLNAMNDDEMATMLSQAFMAELRTSLSSGRRNLMTPVSSEEAVEPEALRLLRGHDALRRVLPRVAVISPQMAVRTAWLADGASVFTFPGAGGIKRRPCGPGPNRGRRNRNSSSSETA